MFKKALAVILTVLFSLSVFTLCVGAESEGADTLQFNEDGSFKIIQVADLQDNTLPVKKTNEYLRKIIEDEKPDLIVLTGDNISDSVARGFTDAHAEKKVRKAIDSFMSLFEEYGIPVAVTFGNHDAEGLVSKEKQMRIYNEYECCVAIDEGEAISGCGTYNLPILSSDGSKIAYNLYMFDSNMYDGLNGGYDHVHTDQIDWYVETSNALKAQNGGEPVPSMAFQHIAVREIYKALVKTDNPDGAVAGDDGYYILPENASGTLRERPAVASVDTLQFTKMVEQGDVKAMFFGHDHENDYVVPYMGIDLICTPAAGFGGYGSDNRGVRVIELNENDTSTYEERLIEYLKTYCTEPLDVMLYHINSIKYIFDMFMMGLTMPIKAFTSLIF